MTWTIQQLIMNEVKKPIRRMYMKRLQRDGTYESNWLRIDSINSINRVIDWGSVGFSVDSDEIIINSWDIKEYSASLINFDGKFNSSSDQRSLWFRFWDHKNTKIKVDIAMESPDGVETGLITIFEGVLQSAKNTAENESKLTILDYSKKLQEKSFTDFGITGSQTVQYILDAIFANTDVRIFFPVIGQTLSPVQDVTIDTDNNNVFSKNVWEVILFIAEKSSSTILVKNDTFYFGGRTVSSTTADYTFTGVGNTTENRRINIYDRIVYDQEGTDKLYTVITDSSSGLTAQTTSAELLSIGKTKTIDLSDLTNSTEKQNVLDQYLAYFGQKRPTLSLPSVVFMMGLLLPFDLISCDNPGTQTEADAGAWDACYWDDGCVYDGDGGSSSVNTSILFVIEEIEYNLQEWECSIFARQKV